MATKGLLVVISGPSGAGKGTVVKSLLSRREENVRLSVSATTRAPRPGETDGREYYFISREKFNRMEEDGLMLENAEYCGNRYGTPSAPIEEWTSQGVDVLLEIEVQGGAQVRKKCPDAVGIFILPPSMKVLEKRLRGRGTERNETVRDRLQVARREICKAANYDYVVVNDEVERAAEEICEILRVEKRRTVRNKQLIERVLNDD